jgi:hypothetical protein
MWTLYVDVMVTTVWFILPEPSTLSRRQGLRPNNRSTKLTRNVVDNRRRYPCDCKISVAPEGVNHNTMKGQGLDKQMFFVSFFVSAQVKLSTKRRLGGTKPPPIFVRAPPALIC